MIDLPSVFEIKTTDDWSSYYIVDLNREKLYWSDSNGHLSVSGVTEWPDYSADTVAKYIETGVWEITTIFEPAMSVEVTDLL